MMGRAVHRELCGQKRIESVVDREDARVQHHHPDLDCILMAAMKEEESPPSACLA